MAVKAKIQKVVSTLPTTLEKNTVYYVRVANGFDIYVTNNSGLIVAYPANYAQANHTHSNLVPYTGATQDLQLVDRNLYFKSGQIQFYGHAKLYHGTPVGASAYGPILWGYDGIEFANRSFHYSPTIFTMNGVEKARVQYNGDFKNEGVLLPQKGIIVKGFSPIIKQNGIDGNTSLIFIKTGFGENYYNITEFKVIIKAYSTTGIKHYEFIVSTYFIRDAVTNYFPNITWVAGNSTEITAIKFYKKDSGGYESYIAIEGDFAYPTVAITEAQVGEGATNTIHPDVWSIDFGSSADLTGKSVTNTFLPNDFKRDKTWLDANYANQSWVSTNYIPKTHHVFNITQTNINAWNNAVTYTHSHSNMNFLNNIDQWLGVGQAPTFSSVRLMDMLGYGQLAFEENYIGGEIGLVDITNERIFAGRINEYLKYGSAVNGFEALNIHFDDKIVTIGKEVTNDEDKVQIKGNISVDTRRYTGQSTELILNPIYNTSGDIRDLRNAHIYIKTGNNVRLPISPILGQKIEIYNRSDSDISVIHDNIGVLFIIPAWRIARGFVSDIGFVFDEEPIRTKEYEV